MELGLTVQDRSVSVKFDVFPEELRSAFLERITAITAELYTRVETGEPSLTGKLRSLTRMVIENTKNRVAGRVQVSGDYGKAGALEYGSTRSVQVRAHSVQRDQVFGRLVEPTAVMIQAHSRQLNITARRYLRGPLEDLRPGIVDQLQAALTVATDKAA
ncbi:MAG: hypothetical protein ACREEN_00510 [Stellaceae bacterium]